MTLQINERYTVLHSNPKHSYCSSVISECAQSIISVLVSTEEGTIEEGIYVWWA